MSKTNRGNFFEDFEIGQVIRHATPRTVTGGDQALYTALYGSRFAVQSSDAFARTLGYAHAPVDDLLTFHIVFGKTVPDVSLNAVANLGYAGGVFSRPFIRVTRCRRSLKSLARRKTPTARPVSFMFARPATHRRVPKCWTTCAG